MKTQAMKAAHTPGPWVAQGYGFGPNGGDVGFCHGFQDDAEDAIEIGVANAAELVHRFNTHPELLAALRGLLEGPGIDVSETALIIGPNAREAIIAARAALASATPQATGE